MVKLNSVRLYLPDDVLSQRLGNDVSPLAKYIKSIEQETTTYWERSGQPKARGLLVVVGVKPGKKTKVWCDPLDGDIPSDIITKLEKTLAAVPTVVIRQGPIAFAMEVQLWGQMPGEFPEMPQAWVEAAKKSKVPLMIPDGLFNVVWPE